MKRLAIYLLYSAGLIILLYLGVRYNEQLGVTYQRDFYYIPFIFFSALFPVIMGAYLALPQVITQLRKPGAIKYDWLKLLIIGLPALLICFSWVLFLYIPSHELSQHLGIMYFRFGTLGTFMAGVAGGYILLNSLTKVQEEELFWEKSKVLAKIPKILALVIGGVLILYIGLNGIIHPLKLISVQGYVSEAEYYTVVEGQEPPKVINYQFNFQNWPRDKNAGYLFEKDKIRIEPKERLFQLTENSFSMEKEGVRNGSGSGSEGNVFTLTISYRIKPHEIIDPWNVDKVSPELLQEIKEALYDAELVIEEGMKVKRYQLQDFQ